MIYFLNFVEYYFFFFLFVVTVYNYLFFGSRESQKLERRRESFKSSKGISTGWGSHWITVGDEWQHNDKAGSVKREKKFLSSHGWNRRTEGFDQFWKISTEGCLVCFDFNMKGGFGLDSVINSL